MGRRENRRDTRHKVRLPMTVKRADHTVDLFTDDVSFRGLYLRTDTPPPQRQLVELSAKLPPDEAPFTGLGMVVHIVEQGNVHGRAPGMGIQFYRLQGSARERWHRFIEHVQANESAESEPPPVVRPAHGLEPINRRHPRFNRELEVELQALGQLHTLKSRDISEGGMFIKTAGVKIDTSAPLQLKVVHPTSKEILELEALVRRKTDSAGEQGIGVEFVNVTNTEKRSLAALIGSDDLLEPIADDDPDLE